MAELTLVEAVNLALHHEMQQDPNVVVLGEDVGDNGGVFRATVGLKQEFGLKRVIDTPLAEALIGGVAVGMATQGLRPVAEFQFQGFVFPAMEHLMCHAARMRNRTRGRLTCPAVFRAPFGGGIHAPEHHSESVEALFAHTAGFKVVIPSSPQRAYGLLLAAIRSNDPVMFFEHKALYRSLSGEVPEGYYTLPIGKAAIAREGAEMTVITYGMGVHWALKSVEELGLDAEVIDLRSLVPLDTDCIYESVMKTGKALVLHEDTMFGGIGGEIASLVNEHCFESLDAPVKRVAGLDTPVPFSPELEEVFLASARLDEALLELNDY